MTIHPSGAGMESFDQRGTSMGHYRMHNQIPRLAIIFVNSHTFSPYVYILITSIFIISISIYYYYLLLFIIIIIIIISTVFIFIVIHTHVVILDI